MSLFFSLFKIHRKSWLSVVCVMAVHTTDAQPGEIEAGATPEQISAFLGGDDEWAGYAGDEEELDTVIQKITDGTYSVDDDYVDPALLGVVDSHTVR